VISNNILFNIINPGGEPTNLLAQNKLMVINGFSCPSSPFKAIKMLFCTIFSVVYGTNNLDNKLDL